MDVSRPECTTAKPAIPLDEAGARLSIDLGALKANYRELAERAAGAETAAVIKADGYGLGLDMVAPALWQAGARSFFVAHLSEARALRHALPGCTIYVLNGLPPGGAKLFCQFNARPVLGSTAEIEEWVGFCAGHEGVPPAAIHVDTGMNRLGLSMEEARALSARKDVLGQFSCDLVISHMACADTPGHPLNARQLEAFRSLRGLFPGARASLANSAATLASEEYHFDLVRPGIALFGGRALQGVGPLRPVATLQARVAQLRNADQGESVGYGATFVCPRPTRIAILTLGYGDGYLRVLGAPSGGTRGFVYAAGRKLPVIGRVSMDLIAIDVSALAADAIDRGDMVEVMGANIALDDLADAAGTIGYELLTRLGGRFSRVYTDSGLA